MSLSDRGRSGRTPAHKRVLALIASLSMLLVGLVGVVMAPAAAAHTPVVSASCENGLSVDLRAYASSGNTVKITIDNVVVVNTGFGRTYNYSNPLSPKTANHTWKVEIDASDDNRYDRTFSGTTTACEKPSYSYEKQVTLPSIKICTPEGTVEIPAAVGDLIKVGPQDTPIDKAAVDKQAQDSADAKRAQQLAQYKDYTVGKCVYSYEKQVTLPSIKICTPEGTVTIPAAVGDLIKVGPQDTPIDKAAVDKQAQDSADAKRAQQLAQYKDYTVGKCVYSYSVTKTAMETICYQGRTSDVKVSGDKVTIPEQDDPISAEDKAKADKKAQDSADAALANELKNNYPGHRVGECAPAKSASLSCETGFTLSLTEYPGGAPVRITGLPTGDVNTFVNKDGSFAYGPTGKLPDGDYTVEVFVAGQQADRVALQESEEVVEDEPNYGEPIISISVKCTPGAQSWTATKDGSVSLDVCTTDGTKTVKVDGSSGVKTSSISQADANTAAETAFNTDIATKTAAALAVPGVTPGACQPKTTNVVAPVNVAAAANVPAPAKKPVVVSAPKPAKVDGGVAGTAAVPETATIPAAVPAGDGSQAPGLPMWALALIVVGAVGAAAAGKQMLGARK